MLNTKFIRHRDRGFVLWDSLTEISHAHMVQLLCFVHAEILSAGFVRFEPGGLPVCEGHSGSLNMGAVPSDTQALRRQLGVVTMHRPTATALVGGGQSL